jgi:hypothetical protein
LGRSIRHAGIKWKELLKWKLFLKKIVAAKTRSFTEELAWKITGLRKSLEKRQVLALTF